jgi:iron(III) transport system substrate-binding protein
MRIRALMAAQLAALTLVATACGGSDDGEPAAASGDGTKDGVVVRMDGESVDDYIQRLYAAAQEEGAAVYYTPAQEREVEALRTYWEETFPKVEFQVTAGATDEILQRALVEGQSGNLQADAMQGSTAEMTLLHAEGLLADYRPANEEFLDAELVDTDQPWTTNFYLTFHVAYNSTNVDPSELPDDFQGFTDPEWKGRLAIDLNAVEWVAGLIEEFGEDDAIELLRGLVANDIRLVEGSTNRTEQLANGEFDVMLDGYGHALKRFVKEGAPIGVADPQPQPVTQVLGVTAIFNDAPHPNAARLVSEFLIMAEGQQAYADQNKAGSRTEGGAAEHPYQEFFGGAEPAPLGPDVDFDRARRVLEEIVVRKG